MIKKMLVNATHPEENRVAIVEDGILSELDIEIAGKEQTKGNIYKATVVRVEQGLQAAFVDYGAERLGFLQMGELHPDLYAKSNGESKGRPRITDVLHRGQEILVQITKEERGNKGAALTTFLSLPGRYMVLMPGDNTRGMSRKIPDGAERKQLKESISGFDLPAAMGYIIRTAAIGQSAEELTRDLQYLLRVYDNIMELSRKTKGPALVYRESNLIIRSLRDYFTQDMDEVLVDDPAVFKEAQEFFQQVMPEYARLVKLHQERRPIFSKYQIEDQIETIAHKQVFMPGGGSIVIDSTEALVAIDVNSGKMASEQGVEGTAYKTNLEAADEVARQLRLRDLGGLVVIDFIDMRDRKHIREVEKRLKDALKPDKARVSVGRISEFGLLEMSRQRIKAALAEGSYLSCPNCQGTGRVRSIEAQAVAFLRKVHAAVARGQFEKIESQVPLAVSHYLLNNKREELIDMERRYQTRISIRGRKSFIADQTELNLIKREKDDKKPSEANEPVTAAHTLGEQREELQPETAFGPEPTEEKPAGKSRSRRRGKKPSRTEQPASDSTSLEDVSESAAAAAPEAAESGVETPSAATPEETAETKRPSRRRRGRRGKKSESATTAVTTGQATEVAEDSATVPEPAAQPAAAESASPVTTDAEQPDAAKPARKRRSRRAKKPTETSRQPNTASDETGTADAAPAEAALPSESASPVPVEHPVAGPKPRSRKAKNPAATAAAKVASSEALNAEPEARDTAVASAPQPAVETVAAAPAEPRRPRKPRKPAAKIDAEQPAATPLSTPAPVPVTDTAEPTEPAPKPAPAPRRRKAPARKPTDAAEEKAPSADIEEKPKRQRRSRKPAAQSEAATPDKPELDQA